MASVLGCVDIDAVVIQLGDLFFLYVGKHDVSEDKSAHQIGDGAPSFGDEVGVVNPRGVGHRGLAFTFASKFQHNLMIPIIWVYRQ